MLVRSEIRVSGEREINYVQILTTGPEKKGLGRSSEEVAAILQVVHNTNASKTVEMSPGHSSKNKALLTHIRSTLSQH